jgi:hypothetical protein
VDKFKIEKEQNNLPPTILTVNYTTQYFSSIKKDPDFHLGLELKDVNLTNLCRYYFNVVTARRFCLYDSSSLPTTAGLSLP